MTPKHRWLTTLTAPDAVCGLPSLPFVRTGRPLRAAARAPVNIDPDTAASGQNTSAHT